MAKAAVKKPLVNDVEAKYVEDFVNGRTKANEGNRLQNHAKSYFERSEKSSWSSAEHTVTLEDGTKAGFDMEAFKAAHPRLFEEFYKVDMPCKKWTVTKR